VSDGGPTPVMGETDHEAARVLSLRGARPPVKVPGYDQEQFLGHGAYGEVWSAVSRNSGVKVAIKFYTRRGGRDWSSLAREVEKLRYLFSDRYVVQLLEVGWESDPPYYVMEYMENGSLEDLLRRGPLPVNEAVAYFREVAVALVHAHNKGILHCDLKPANILLDQDRRPRLADFGQSRLTNEMSPALGTLYYMAPEQADLTATPDARWDVYALGAVVYRMLTGEPPYYQDRLPGGGNLEAQLHAYRQHLRHAPKPTAHRRVPGVDAELAGIIDRCLETTAADRFPDPQAVVTALDAWSLRRVRRPILQFTAAGFFLLLLMMVLVGGYLFHTTVRTARSEIIDRTLAGNRFAAHGEAEQMALETEHRWRVLEFEATDPRLRQWLREPPATPPGQPQHQPQPHPLDAWLHSRLEKYNRDFRKGSEATLWLALDRQGRMRGMDDPQFAHLRYVYFGYRDYFHGQGVNLPETSEPPDPLPPIITAPHRSMVYRRKTSGRWAVTFSVPVTDADRPEPIGILAMSIDLNPFDDSYDTNRFSVLVDTRPDVSGRRGLIVRHPYMARLPSDTPDDSFPLYYATSLVAAAQQRPDAWQLIPDYRDPVERPPFSGEWLAAVEPVRVRLGNDSIDTGFLVVVQERRDGVLAPVAWLQWRLVTGGAVAALFLVAVIVLMGAGTVAVLDGTPKSRVSRLLRRWAGLPTAPSASPATPPPATGSGTPTTDPARQTARVRSAATPPAS
jgi:serine/threonine protein kinase